VRRIGNGGIEGHMRAISIRGTDGVDYSTTTL
jgi:hypothetical protein